MTLKISKIFFCFLFTATTLSLPVFAVQAQNLNDAFKVGDRTNNDPLDSFAYRAGYDTNQTDIYTVISAIIRFSLSFLGVIFMGLMIYGGWLWMTDQGNEEQVEKAKKIITAAVIGLIIIVSSYAISYFIINALSQNTVQGG